MLSTINISLAKFINKNSWLGVQDFSTIDLTIINKT